MKISTLTEISGRIIILFTVAMFMSFIPEYLHDFFGDWKCTGSVFISDPDAYGRYVGCLYEHGEHQSTIHWGYRHWLFLAMGICLSIVQIFNFFKFLEKQSD